MDRAVYRVVPDGDEWVVSKDGMPIPLGRFERKRSAVERGRAAAEANRPSRLVVHGQNGPFEEEYPRRDDSSPPEE